MRGWAAFVHQRLSGKGALALGQSGLRDDGRLPLDARPAGKQLGDGRNGRAAGQAPRERGGRVGRRVRSPAVPLPQSPARQPTRGQYPFAGTARRVLRTNGCCPLLGSAAGGHLHLALAESAGRFPREGPDRRPLVRRRDVVRLDQYPRAIGQGPRRQGVQYVHLHRGRRLSGPLHPLPGQRDHAGGHRALRRPRGDGAAGPDHRVQVCPGSETRPGRPPAGRQEHAQCGGLAGNGRGCLALLALPVPQRLLGGRP